MTRSSGTRLRTIPPPRRAVLVVESDGIAASAWASAIREALEVDVVSSATVYEARAAGPHTVIVLGQLAGGESALELARELATRPSHRRPRVVLLLTSALRRIDRVHLDATIERPFATDVLVAHVRRLLGLEQRRRGLRAPTRVRGS